VLVVDEEPDKAAAAEAVAGLGRLRHPRRPSPDSDDPLYLLM